MRYYDLTLTDSTGKVVKQWTSHPNGVYNPSALNVEFDVLVSPQNDPIGLPTLTIEGISLIDLTQAQKYVGLSVLLKGGMLAGLPLNNPAQAGILVQGQVFQAFGNWEGTEMTLDLVLNPDTYSMTSPGNITLVWAKGTTLQQAMTQCFAVAYPGVQTKFNISSNLVAPQDVVLFASSMTDLAQQIWTTTSGLFNNAVSIVFQSGYINVLDTTYSNTPTQLQFTDFVGQPTWIEPGVLQVKMVMRGDLIVGNFVKMPYGMQDSPGIVTTYAASMPSSMKYKSTFTGDFQVNQLRHVGNFRAADGASWVTIANCLIPTNG